MTAARRRWTGSASRDYLPLKRHPIIQEASQGEAGLNPEDTAKEIRP